MVVPVAETGLREIRESTERTRRHNRLLTKEATNLDSNIVPLDGKSHYPLPGEESKVVEIIDILEETAT
jgi:hypothetical protein